MTVRLREEDGGIEPILHRITTQVAHGPRLYDVARASRSLGACGLARSLWRRALAAALIFGLLLAGGGLPARADD